MDMTTGLRWSYIVVVVVLVAEACNLNSDANDDDRAQLAQLGASIYGGAGNNLQWNFGRVVVCKLCNCLLFTGLHFTGRQKRLFQSATAGLHILSRCVLNFFLPSLSPSKASPSMSSQTAQTGYRPNVHWCCYGRTKEAFDCLYYSALVHYRRLWQWLA